MSTQDNIKKFQELCDKHDITYDSADGEDYRKGKANYDEIRKVMKLIPQSVAKNIWNKMVEKKLLKHVWDNYKWK